MTITTRRVRHETRFRLLTVRHIERLTPRMARIVFHSPELEGFISLGFDDHVRLFFPEPGQPLAVPTPGERGVIWPDPMPQTRDYTPRAFDADRSELTIDFVLHEGGVASDWAAKAQTGDAIGIGGPRGSFLVEGEADWHLLVGDATALPAIGRRIEELPAGTRVLAVIEIADSAEMQEFAAPAEVTWLQADRGQNLSGWLAGVELPPGEGFVFFAAEASAVSAARPRFAALGLPDSHLKAANYWRAGVADAHDH